jgi:hypothetical protein
MAGCLLDRFLPWSAAQQALALTATLELELTFWAVLLDVLAMMLGLLLLVHGGRLNATVLFVVGFVCGAAICSPLTYAALSALGWSSCLLLSALPLAAGLACGLAVRRSPNATFGVLGVCVGGVLGYCVYSLIHVFLLELLLIPAAVGGLAAVALKGRILTAATAVVGAFSFMLGFTYLVLAQIDARFARWLTPEAAQLDQFTLLPPALTLALALSGGTVQRLWWRASAKADSVLGGNSTPLLDHVSLGRKKSRWQRVKDWWSPPRPWWQQLAS